MNYEMRRMRKIRVAVLGINIASKHNRDAV
jgi:hypothetical protein